jgi:hypothetical protein
VHAQHLLKGDVMTIKQTAAVLGVGFTLGACSSPASGPGGVVEVEHEATVGVSWEEYRAAARKLGRGEQLVAEWDLVFKNEAALQAHYEEVALREKPKLAVFTQLSTGYEPTYSAGEKTAILYCVSNTFSNKSTVVQDMAGAAADWFRVTNVNFRYQPQDDATCETNASVDLKVLPNVEAGLAGCGMSLLMDWFEGGCPYGSSDDEGKGVLSVNYSAFPLFPGLTGRGLFRHELGHVLGFRHEHPWAPNPVCSEQQSSVAFDIGGRRLTAYDQTSVMHYPSCGGIPNTDNTISASDGIGARSIYGIPAAWYVPITG